MSDGHVDDWVRERALGDGTPNADLPARVQSDWERECNEGRRAFLPLRFLAEECSTLAEVAIRLRGTADEIDVFIERGFVLDEPVENGYVSLFRPHGGTS
jgi:hypothetical protein